jgi:hypothetical protein
MIMAMKDDQAGRLFKAIYIYQVKGIEPDDDDSIYSQFCLMKAKFEEDNEGYQRKCDMNKRIALEREEQKRKTERNQTCTNVHEREPNVTAMHQDAPEHTDTDKDTDKDTDTDKDNDIDKKSVARTQEQKHIYGEYKHVRLTDQEFSKLVNDYGEHETQEAISLFDEYIEEKGYKSKSHYLAMRRWVFKAVQERRQRQTARSSTQRSELDAWASA